VTYTYTPPSELEIAFKEWLGPKQADVKEEFMRWLENPDGGCLAEDWCVRCVEIQRYREKHKKSRYTRINGWNEHFESDSPRWCSQCGVLLCFSLTEYGVDMEISEILATAKDLHAEEAFILFELLDGMGNYIREKHWPMMEPHAKRLMASNTRGEE